MKIAHRSHSTCRRLAAVILAWLPMLLIASLLSPPAAAQTHSNRQPLIIAHRGGALESTENTIAAFQRAFRIGADGIETDIRLTRDGTVVVYHDETFGRVEGLPKAQRTRLISDMTY